MATIPEYTFTPMSGVSNNSKVEPHNTFRHWLTAYSNLRTYCGSIASVFNSGLQGVKNWSNNLVSAINEIQSRVSDTENKIGTLSSLTTTVKDNLVSAINEIRSGVSSHTSSLGKMGDLTQLKTTSKNTLVASNNELHDKIVALENLVGKNGLNVGDTQTIIGAVNDLNTRLTSLEDAGNV